MFRDLFSDAVFISSFPIPYCNAEFPIPEYLTSLIHLPKIPMNLKHRDPEKLVHAVTLATLGAMVVWGVVSVVWEVRPFWVDEWRIIYNLKFKTVGELWGKLAFMQQFPRAYISALKWFIQWQGYSYFSLRLPSLVVALAAMAAVYRLARRVWGQSGYRKYFIVLMLVSCGTFTEYFVQVKQYTMDLFLAVIALWQLVWLRQSGERRAESGNVASGERKMEGGKMESGLQGGGGRGPLAELRGLGYLLLCLGLLAAPFFSYTYPIVIAPVFLVVLVQDVALWRQRPGAETVKRITLQWLPLFLCTFSITVFYVADVAQLSADGEMRGYWRGLVNEDGFSIGAFVEHVFHMLAQAGSGFVFWWLFGLLCTAAFGCGCYMVYGNLRRGATGMRAMMLLYAVALVLLMLALNVAGRLPLGEPRLNAFAVPAIAILLINLLDAVAAMPRLRKAGAIVSYVLIAGLAGNVLSTIYASFADGKYERRMATYRATQRAIALAQAQHLPILVTPEVTWPYDKTENLPWHTNVPGDWVLMTWPAFDARGAVQVYNIPDTQDVQQYLGQLPNGTEAAMVGDGLHYRSVAVHKKQIEPTFNDTMTVK